MGHVFPFQASGRQQVKQQLHSAFALQLRVAPPAILPSPGMTASAPLDWTPWDLSRGTPHRPRGFAPAVGAWDAQAALDDLRAAQAADCDYASVDALADAMRTQLAALAGAAEFRPWVRADPTFKTRLSGFLSTAHIAQGVRHVTILLDTGATHCFICARLAAGLGLPPSGQHGARSLATAAAVPGAAGTGDAGPGAPQPGRRVLRVDVRLPDRPGRGRRPGSAQFQLALLPPAARPPPAT
jgi:hypothetical protein